MHHFRLQDDANLSFNSRYFYSQLLEAYYLWFSGAAVLNHVPARQKQAGLHQVVSFRDNIML